MNVHKFEISLQALAAVSAQFIDHQFALVLHEPRQVPCFTARGRAEVKHSIPGLGRECGGDSYASRCVHPRPPILKAWPSLGRFQAIGRYAPNVGGIAFRKWWERANFGFEFSNGIGFMGSGDSARPIR